MRNKRIYIKTIAISVEDLSYVKKEKVEGAKSFAGVLSSMISFYRKNKNNKSTDSK